MEQKEETKKKEEFKNATTKQAIVLIGWYQWCIVRNIGKAIDRAVHKFPWVCMAVVIVIDFIVSFVFISKARAERDSYNKKMVHTEMELSSYKAVFVDSGKEVK